MSLCQSLYAKFIYKGLGSLSFGSLWLLRSSTRLRSSVQECFDKLPLYTKHTSKSQTLPKSLHIFKIQTRRFYTCDGKTCQLHNLLSVAKDNSQTWQKSKAGYFVGRPAEEKMLNAAFYTRKHSLRMK